MEKSVMTDIGGWNYMVTLKYNGVEIWHHVTPADGGYGADVKMLVPFDDFLTRTVEEICGEVASCQVFSLGGPSETNIDDMIKILDEFGVKHLPRTVKEDD